MPGPLSDSPSRGRFVVFEGGEGSGKSTQARRLADRCGGLFTFQPGATNVGAEMRKILLSPSTEFLDPRAEALLMAADRAQHVAEVIRPTLDAGKHVICDRYLASSMAYQGAGRDLGVEVVRDISLFATENLVPDVVILLDVPVDIGRTRLGETPDRLEAEGREFHETIRSAFRSFADGHPERWVTIDGTQALAEVSAQVDAVVADRFGW